MFKFMPDRPIQWRAYYRVVRTRPRVVVIEQVGEPGETFRWPHPETQGHLVEGYSRSTVDTETDLKVKALRMAARAIDLAKGLGDSMGWTPARNNQEEIRRLRKYIEDNLELIPEVK